MGRGVEKRGLRKGGGWGGEEERVIDGWRRKGCLGKGDSGSEPGGPAFVWGDGEVEVQRVCVCVTGRVGLAGYSWWAARTGNPSWRVGRGILGLSSHQAVFQVSSQPYPFLCKLITHCPGRTICSFCMLPSKLSVGIFEPPGASMLLSRTCEDHPEPAWSSSPGRVPSRSGMLTVCIWAWAGHVCNPIVI